MEAYEQHSTAVKERMIGEMAQRITAHDWAATSLGPRGYWPISLRTAVDLMLSARQPAYVSWGYDLRSLYNDAFIPIMGAKHPAALGQPYSTVFAEVWDTSQPAIAATFSGETQYFVDCPIALPDRPNSPMSWFTFSWTPLRDDEGTVRGFYCAATETTQRVQAQLLKFEQTTQFQTLVDQAPIGIYLIDADFRLRHVNPAALSVFADLPNVIGRDFVEILHMLWHSSFADELVDTFRTVLVSGNPFIEPERVERRAVLNTLEYYAYRIDRILMPDRRYGLVCYFRDVTEQVHARRALAETQLRQDFLLKLSDALAPMDDAICIKAEAARLIGEQLGANHAFYFDYDEQSGIGTVQCDYAAQGEPTVTGQHTERHFPTIIRIARQGRVFAAADISQEHRLLAEELERLAQLNVHALAFSPLVKAGRLVTLFSVTYAAPHVWSALELNLVRETAERTWAAVERARAEAELRHSVEHYRASVELSPQIAWTAAADGRISTVSPRWTELTGRSVEHPQGADWLRTVHLEDEERATAAWANSLATGQPLDQEVRILTRQHVYHWARARAYPQRATDGTIMQWFGTLEDVEDRHAVAVALRDSEQRLHTLIERMPQLVWRAVDAGSWTWSSAQWIAYTGQSAAESHGQGWLNAVHPDDRESARTAWQAAVAGAAFDAEYRLLHVAEQRYRWFRSRATPVRNERDELIEWLGTSTDVDEQRQLHLRQEVLVAELQHRTRNLIAVVRSTAERTLRTSTSIGDFEDKFRERLAALARVQGLLSRLHDGGRIMFDELLRTELTALGALDESGSRVLLRGPGGVALRSSTVQILAMALHELATNAAKYGALRQPHGRLEVQWSLEPVASDEQPWLHLDWRERRVNMPVAGEMPQGNGHGRELIERALPYQLGARTSFTLEADGIHCCIALPISQRQGPDGWGAS